jgi:hypothetical protein
MNWTTTRTADGIPGRTKRKPKHDPAAPLRHARPAAIQARHGVFGVARRDDVFQLGLRAGDVVPGLPRSPGAGIALGDTVRLLHDAAPGCGSGFGSAGPPFPARPPQVGDGDAEHHPAVRRAVGDGAGDLWVVEGG